MNNFINFSKKMQRNTLERSIISAANKQIPNIEQYIGAHRYPVLPKIVVYSAAANANSFLEKYASPYVGYSPSTMLSLPPSALRAMRL